MKLLELLKTELPNRGGWPASNNLCWQDSDKEIRFDCGVEHDFYVKMLTDQAAPLGYHPIIDGVYYCVTREQYEADK